MKKVIITEKANAARRISTILSDGKSRSGADKGVTCISFEIGGDEYDVVSLRGHIMGLDYPEEFSDWRKGSPVDLVYAPQVKTIQVKSILNKISELVKDADEIIIATDFDREGELIGMETITAVNVDMTKVKRAKFSALTKGEVEKAFANLTLPDKQLSDAAEARQIVDLTWGAVLTRLISLSSGQVGKNFMSVGRVQSPTLKLLVDRHEEITSFISVPYWNLTGKFGMLAFKGEHESNPFYDEKVAQEILEKIKDCKKGRVTKFEVSMKDEYRPSPFDTTQMQVEANKIGIPPTVTMKLAEDLYTGGYISYPRTENTEYPYSLSMKSVLEKLKNTEFGPEVEEILKQEKIFPSKGKRRTTDHPPIYPTAGASSDKMKGDKWKLYELIVRRFLATVGPLATAESIKCEMEINGETFVSNGYIQKELGWKKYYKKYIKIANNRVPVMEVGDEIDIRTLNAEGLETKPPYRYNQGSLIQEMDKLHLGTKSTRHDIIGKLFSRNYVQGNFMTPTASGMALTKSLQKHGGGITEPEMTAKLEADMLKISEGELKLKDVVNASQKMLFDVATEIESKNSEIGEEIRTALHSQQMIGICVCGNNMIIKKSKNGNFIGCGGYPECTHAYPMPRGALVQTTEDKCDKCGLPQLKIIRKGVPPVLQCVNPKCESNTERNNLGLCPTCKKGTIRLMFSKMGRRFAGCSEWPNCVQTYPMRPKGVILPSKDACETCESPIIQLGSLIECINLDCPGKKRNINKKTTQTDDTNKDEKPKKTVVVRKKSSVKKSPTKDKKE